MRKASILGVNSWEDALGVLPPMAGEQPADNDQILSLITAI